MSAIGRATLAGRWRQAVGAGPHRPFLRWEGPDGSVADWTYEQFDGLTAAVAGGLVKRGVGPGDAVHLALPNSPAFVALWLAVSQLGACIVPADPESTARELREHFRQTKPVLGVCSAAGKQIYAAAAAGTVDTLAVDVADVDIGDLHGQPMGWSDIPLPPPSQTGGVLFTSGTTSAPKGVVVTQANYAFAGDVMAAAAALTAEDRQLVVLPLFHANAQYYSFASAISAGASVALMHRFSASRFLSQAKDHGATHASLFAAPMRMILARGVQPVAGIRLRHVWYAQNVSADQYRELGALFGCKPRQLYGMTETIPAVLSNRALDPVIDSLGTPTLGCHVDLFDENHAALVPDGEAGEIVVRGDRAVSLFAEYLGDPVSTEACFAAGWFRTGDRAWRDGEGRFYFAGRAGDLLKVSGENVSLVEVETVLSEHPEVLEAAVVGQPDPVRDEVPVAFVVPRPGQQLLQEDLQRHCAERLAPAKRPREFHVVDGLPRTSVGKIRKFLLKPPAERSGT